MLKILGAVQRVVESIYEMHFVAILPFQDIV